MGLWPAPPGRAARILERYRKAVRAQEKCGGPETGLSAAGSGRVSVNYRLYVRNS